MDVQVNQFATSFFNRPDVPGELMGLEPLTGFDRALAVAADQNGATPGDGVVHRAEVEGYVRRYDTEGVGGKGDGVLNDAEQARLRSAFEAPIQPGGTTGVTDAAAARIFAKASPSGAGTIDIDRDVQDPALRNFLYRADNIDGADSPHADRRVEYGDIKRTLDIYAHNGPRLVDAEIRTLLDENPGLIV